MSMTKSQESTLVPIPLPRHNDVIVIEKRFGYDRLGIIISLLVICFLVVLICIPTALEYFVGDDYQQINNIVLVSLIVVLILVSLGILAFMNFQHKQAKKQRLNSTYGIYTLERQRMRRNQSRAGVQGGKSNENSTSMIELQSLKLDLNSNEKKHKMMRHQHHHYHIPADNDSHSTSSSSKKTALLS